MNLEDHLGDILRKARAMSGVTLADASRAAGLSEGDLCGLEESGFSDKRPNWTAIARVLGLHAGKLESIANGWLPDKKDLRTWRELRVFTSTDGGMAVNAYLVWDEVTRDAALFDTGWNVRDALEEVEANQLLLRHLFITHGHHDHVAAMDAVCAAFPRVRLHRGDRNAPRDQRTKPSECVQMGRLRITHRETPGHAEDGVTYLIDNWPEESPQVAIVGDALFAGSIGRGNQSWELARKAVREQILTLPDDTLLCPGHGPLTTVAEEKAHNPFF